jgi:hypothetical protein
MNINVATQNQGRVAWTGGATPVATAIDVRNHINFAFSFEVITDITTNAVFSIQAAPPSAGNPCLPGTFVPIPEISICGIPAVPGPAATLTIPAGTKAGSLCSATLPCKPAAFVKLVVTSGDTAKVSAVAILSGPR